MPRRSIYLRLVDKADDRSPESERLRRVKIAIEKFGDVEWLQHPSLHGRGGYQACFTVPDSADCNALPSLVDREGYLAVI